MNPRASSRVLPPDLVRAALRQPCYHRFDTMLVRRSWFFFALAVAVLLTGCAYRRGSSDRNAHRPGDRSTTRGPAAIRATKLLNDLRLTALEQVRQNLVAQLVGAEKQLLAAIRRAPERARAERAQAAAIERRELAERRLLLSVALVEVEQAIEQRRAELVAGIISSSAGSASGQSSSADVEPWLERAAVRLAAARLAQKVLKAKEKQALGERYTSTVINFGDDTIEGDLLRPGESYIAPRRPRKGPSPIVLDPESKESETKKPDRPPPAKAPPAPPLPGKRGGVYAAVVRDQPPPVGVMPVVERHLPRLLACIPRNLRAAGPINLRVKARLSGKGRFREPRISATVSLPARVNACLVDVLLRMRFPSVRGGPTRVVAFPLWLNSR